MKKEPGKNELTHINETPTPHTLKYNHTYNINMKSYNTDQTTTNTSGRCRL